MLRQVFLWVSFSLFFCSNLQAQDAQSIPQGASIIFNVLNDITLSHDRDETMLLAKPLEVVTPKPQALHITLPDYCVASGKALLLNGELDIRMDKAFCIQSDKRVLDMQFDAVFDVQSYQGRCQESANNSQDCQGVMIQTGEQFSITLSKPVPLVPRRVYE